MGTTEEEEASHPPDPEDDPVQAHRPCHLVAAVAEEAIKEDLKGSRISH